MEASQERKQHDKGTGAHGMLGEWHHVLGHPARSLHHLLARCSPGTEVTKMKRIYSLSSRTTRQEWETKKETDKLQFNVVCNRDMKRLLGDEEKGAIHLTSSQGEVSTETLGGGNAEAWSPSFEKEFAR